MKEVTESEVFVKKKKKKRMEKSVEVFRKSAPSAPSGFHSPSEVHVPEEEELQLLVKEEEEELYEGHLLEEEHPKELVELEHPWHR